jgi:hypothetical protein
MLNRIVTNASKILDIKLMTSPAEDIQVRPVIQHNTTISSPTGGKWKELRGCQKTQVYLRDENLGFPPPDDDEDLQKYDECVPKWKELHSESKKKWTEFFLKSQAECFSSELNVNRPALEAQIWKSEIPAVFRAKVWMECMDIDRLVKQNEGYYDKILTIHVHQSCEAANQIELDLNRTFPDHPYFNSEIAPGKLQMRRVLTAYAWRNPHVNYCQSLNYICGILLLHFSEEEAFWVCAMSYQI